VSSVRVLARTRSLYGAEGTLIFRKIVFGNYVPRIFSASFIRAKNRSVRRATAGSVRDTASLLEQTGFELSVAR